MTITEVTAGQVVAAVQTAKAELSRQLASNKRTAVSAWLAATRLVLIVGPFMPLLAMAPLYWPEVLLNIVPAVKWVSVCLLAGLSMPILAAQAFYLGMVAFRNFDTDDVTSLRKCNNGIAGLTVSLGLLRRNTVRATLRKTVNVLAVLCLFAATCYTSGAIMLVVVAATRLGMAMCRHACNAWLEELPMAEAERLSRRPWETKNTDDPPETRAASPVPA